MKRTFLLLLATGVLSACGCPEGTPEPFAPQILKGVGGKAYFVEASSTRSCTFNVRELPLQHKDVPQG